MTISATAQYHWRFDTNGVDWSELSTLYRIAPLAEKPPEKLEIAFNNSMFKCFVYVDSPGGGAQLVGAGRALADGADCSYLCDIAVHPAYQGKGLGKQIVQHLMDVSKAHRKIILYAAPGREGLYLKFGFSRMKTAMATFGEGQESARTRGLIE
jgi:ribosomal protein S18 acetylase RimI-like enzyme